MNKKEENNLGNFAKSKIKYFEIQLEYCKFARKLHKGDNFMQAPMNLDELEQWCHEEIERWKQYAK